MESDSIAINPKTYSLQEVMQSIQSILQKTYANRQYWVRCELSRISLHAQSGHCYLELIDKNETAIVAQLRGIIWADKYKAICEKFKAVTNASLSGGMKVLLLCSVSFHPVHGLSLTISDIEPAFTLGEMARMKNESIAKLKSEGLFNQNRNLKLPLLPGRIALVSVETSRGYQDFISTLLNHQPQYSIHCTLFEAVLQGENAVPTLIRALKKIFSEKEKFDAIAIIRGGAGDAGLACYDEFSLSSCIAQSPLPVITGIGHATNETVVEMIAFKNCITPTAAATFILEKFDTQAASIDSQIGILNESSKSYLSIEKQFLSALSERFCMLVRNDLNRQEFLLKNLLGLIPAYVKSFFSLSKQNINLTTQAVLASHKISSIHTSKLSEQTLKLKTVSLQLKYSKESLEHLSEKVNLLNPVNTLKRGYSITRHNGKIVTDASEAMKGSKIETELATGIIKSIVE